MRPNRTGAHPLAFFLLISVFGRIGQVHVYARRDTFDAGVWFDERNRKVNSPASIQTSINQIMIEDVEKFT